jgi:hypothetical protein
LRGELKVHVKGGSEHLKGVVIERRRGNGVPTR